MSWKPCKPARRRKLFRIWSGRWESNPRPKLGKLLYCHCTTPAHASSLLIIHNYSASLFVIVLTGPIASVSLLRSSCPGTSIQYWKKYSSTPFLRLNRVRTEGFCPARRLMHFPLFRVAENWRQLHVNAREESR